MSDFEDYENEDYENYDNEGSDFEDEDFVGGTSQYARNNALQKKILKAYTRPNGGRRGGSSDEITTMPYFGEGGRKKGGIALTTALSLGMTALPLARQLFGFGKKGGRMSFNEMAKLHGMNQSRVPTNRVMPAYGYGSGGAMPWGAIAKALGGRKSGGFSLGDITNLARQLGTPAKQLLPLLGQHGQTASNLLGAVGFGKRRGRKPKGGWGMPSFNDLYNVGQMIGTPAKHLLNNFGGEYGKTAGDVLGAVGFGKRRGRKPRGGWGMPSFNDLYNVGQMVGTPAKHLLNNFGGEYGKSAGDVLGAIGFGKKRRAKKGGFNFGQLLNQAQGLVKPVAGLAKLGLPMLGEHGKMASNVIGALGYGRRGGASGGDRRSARASVVRQVMSERGVSLPQASSIVKQEGLF